MKRPKPLVEDRKAMEIIESVGIDLPKLTSPISELSHVAWIVRCICFERLARDFLRRYPDATVVNIGCGLDTTYERVNNGSVRWYDLDLPEVIELRRQFMAESLNRKFISSSFLSDKWFKEILYNEHILFMAAGVFYYFEEKEIRRFLTKISYMFPSSEMVFDATSPAGVRATNRILEKTCNHKKSFLRWGLKDVETLLSWNPRFRLLGKYYTYKQKNLPLSAKNRILGWISDLLDMQYIIHIKVRFDYKHLK
jgi:O-methyltransferase involved in polyketide biosynthesis